MSLIEQLVVDTIEEYERLAGEYSRKAEALRAEWAALNQSVDYGWIEWRGHDCPVANGLFVEVKFRGGGVARDHAPEGWDWECSGSNDDIVAYRIIKEEA